MHGKLIVTLAVILGVFAGGYFTGVNIVTAKWDKQKADDEMAWNQERETLDADRTAAEAKARAAAGRADAEYQRGVEDGKATTDRLIADLRSGNLRLHANVKAARVSAANEFTRGAGVGYAKARAELSAADSEFLLRIGGEADEVTKQLGACQAILNADREAVR